MALTYGDSSVGLPRLMQRYMFFLDSFTSNGISDIQIRLFFDMRYGMDEVSQKIEW